jgi:hypothetical protein
MFFPILIILSTIIYGVISSLIAPKLEKYKIQVVVMGIILSVITIYIEKENSGESVEVGNRDNDKKLIESNKLSNSNKTPNYDDKPTKYKSDVIKFKNSVSFEIEKRSGEYLHDIVDNIYFAKKIGIENYRKLKNEFYVPNDQDIIIIFPINSKKNEIFFGYEFVVCSDGIRTHSDFYNWKMLKNSSYYKKSESQTEIYFGIIDNGDVVRSTLEIDDNIITPIELIDYFDKLKLNEFDK